MKNAIGDTTAMTFDNDSCKKNTNINPNKNMEVIIPAVIINAKTKLLLCFVWFAKYDKNAGYNGSIHTAVKGAAIPAKNAMKIFSNNF